MAEAVIPVSFLNTGRILKPYAPVFLRYGRDAAGNITLAWTRRTRLPGAPFRSEAPLGEATEGYELIIYTTGYAAAAITYHPIVQTLVVPTADQIAAFGSLRTAGNCYWGVAQLGQMGYGYEARSIA